MHSILQARVLEVIAAQHGWALLTRALACLLACLLHQLLQAALEHEDLILPKVSGFKR